MDNSLKKGLTKHEKFDIITVSNESEENRMNWELIDEYMDWIETENHIEDEIDWEDVDWENWLEV